MATISIEQIESDNILLNDELQQKMLVYFAKKNQNAYENLSAAISNGDIKLAHRLAHSLKGNAGQLGLSELQSISEDIEFTLKANQLPSDDKITSLKTELNIILDSLKPLLDEEKTTEVTETISFDEKLELLNELSKLLDQKNTKCLSLLDKIALIPETKELVAQIEDYDFSLAAETLNSIMEGLKGEV